MPNTPLGDPSDFPRAMLTSWRQLRSLQATSADQTAVDLHIHTTASDGTWDVDDVLAQIESHQIGLFAITDHNSIDSAVAMAKRCLGTSAPAFLFGAEISATHQDREFHLTAYDFDAANESILRILRDNRDARERCNAEIIARLAEIHPEISSRAYAEYQHDPRRGGWAALNYSIDSGVVRDASGYFRLCESLPRAPRALFASPQTIIAAVRQANGLCFLAHPSAYSPGKQMTDKELRGWIDLGASGIECYSPHNPPDHAAAYRNFCEQHDLLTSAGSDCHGAFGARSLGVPRVTLDQLCLGAA